MSLSSTPTMQVPLYRLEVLRHDEAVEFAFIPESAFSLRPSATAVRRRLPLRATKTLLQGLEDRIEVFFPTQGFSGGYIGFSPQREQTVVYLLDGRERSLSGRIPTSVLLAKITALLSSS